MDSNSILFFAALAMWSASPESGADTALLNAYLKQSGIERITSKAADDFQRRNTTAEVRLFVGYAAVFVKAAVENRVTVQWRF